MTSTLTGSPTASPWASASADASADASPGPQAIDPARARRRARLRLLALGALTVALIGLGRASGLGERLEGDGLRALVEEAGPLGPPLFIALFALGELIHIPGFVFVAGGVLAYGKLWGGALGFVAAVISVTVSFLVVRGVGGRPLAAVERPLLKKALERLDARPLSTVFWLRTIFFMAPPLNYALALSSVPFRHYVLGSALGLALPLAGLAVALDWLFRQDLRALASAAWPYALAAIAVGVAVALALRLRRAQPVAA